MRSARRAHADTERPGVLLRPQLVAQEDLGDQPRCGLCMRSKPLSTEQAWIKTSSHSIQCPMPDAPNECAFSPGLFLATFPSEDAFRRTRTPFPPGPALTSSASRTQLWPSWANTAGGRPTSSSISTCRGGRSLALGRNRRTERGRNRPDVDRLMSSNPGQVLQT